jgi:hypothetical protein
VLNAPWSEKIVENNSSISAPKGTKYMQYEVAFSAPGFVSSPKLTSVAIEGYDILGI